MSSLVRGPKGRERVNVLKPLVIKLTTSPVMQPSVAGAPARATVATRG